MASVAFNAIVAPRKKSAPATPAKTTVVKKMFRSEGGSRGGFMKFMNQKSNRTSAIRKQKEARRTTGFTRKAVHELVAQ
jgi:hypothetical protein